MDRLEINCTTKQVTVHELTPAEEAEKLANDAISDLITAEIERIRSVQAAAVSTAAMIPDWASWTEAEALAWHDLNIKDILDTAPATVTTGNVVAVVQGLLDLLVELQKENRALVRMVLAQRNELWPNLEGS